MYQCHPSWFRVNKPTIRQRPTFHIQHEVHSMIIARRHDNYDDDDRRRLTLQTKNCRMQLEMVGLDDEGFESSLAIRMAHQSA
jgi:hypothetical protein